MTKIAYTGKPQLAAIVWFTNTVFYIIDKKKNQSPKLFCPKFHLRNSKYSGRKISPFNTSLSNIIYLLTLVHLNQDRFQLFEHKRTLTIKLRFHLPHPCQNDSYQENKP
jgi:hypothetical protein